MGYYKLEVPLCPEHHTICRVTRKDGHKVDDLSDTLPNTPGSKADLHYGVLFAASRSKLAFIDVNEHKIISVLKDVDSSKPLWPMFGVYNPYWVEICPGSTKYSEGTEYNVQYEETKHFLSSGSHGLILNCIHLEYDNSRVNRKYAHIDKGHLVNTPSKTQEFTNFIRTSSTAPLPETGTTLPLTGSPLYWEVRASVHVDKPLTDTNLILETGTTLPQTGSLLYWEVRASVRVDKPLPDTNLILETGLCREEDMDVMHGLPPRPYNYKLEVILCPEHHTICRVTRKDGHKVDDLPDTLPNTPGSKADLHYGVLFDASRSKLAFIDVNEHKIISVLKDVDSSKPLWPMFGVYNPYWISVQMKLVVGKDVEMTKEKKTLIVQALS